MLNSEWNFTSPSPELSTIEPPPTPVMWWGGLTQVFQLVWHKDSVSAVMRWTDRSLGCVWHKDRVSAVTRWTVLVSDTRTVSVLWRGGLTQVSGQCLTQGQCQCCDEVDWHRSPGSAWHKDRVSAVMRWTDIGLWHKDRVRAMSDTRTGSVLWWGGLLVVLLGGGGFLSCVQSQVDEGENGLFQSQVLQAVHHTCKTNQSVSPVQQRRKQPLQKQKQTKNSQKTHSVVCKTNQSVLSSKGENSPF